MKVKNPKNIEERAILSRSYDNMDLIPVQHLAVMLGIHPDTLIRRYPKAIVRPEPNGTKVVMMVKRSLCC